MTKIESHIAADSPEELRHLASAALGLAAQKPNQEPEPVTPEPEPTLPPEEPAEQPPVEQPQPEPVEPVAARAKRTRKKGNGEDE